MANHIWVILLNKELKYGIITAVKKSADSRRIKKSAWYAAVMLLGGAYYAALEILWRGYTHWTMILVGGAAILCMYVVFDARYRLPVVIKCIVSALTVCALEFVSGCIINLWLGMAVWDYSTLSFNILGQICPLFFCIWFVLSLPASAVCRLVHRLELRFLDGGKSENKARP